MAEQVVSATNWFQAHVYVAAWASPTITLIGLIIRNTIRPADKVNWSLIMVYVAFLTCLAAMLTPGTELGIRWLAGSVGSLAFGFILVDAGWKR
jgi:hypothetical protein